MKIGEILIKEKIINENDLNSALELQKISKDKIGKIFVDMGFLDNMDLIKYLSLNQVKPALGELLITAGILNEEKLNEALDIQKAKKNKKLGDILIDLEYIDKNILAHFLTVQAYSFLSTKNKAEIENGYGSIIGDSQSKYVGEIKNSRMHGKGVYSDHECRYVGDFQNGEFHGEGTMTAIDGHVLHSGGWLNGKPV